MILEAAFLQIKPNMTEQFEIDFLAASEYISSIDGYIKHHLQKCLEDDHKYLLLVEWNTLEDHTIGFRQSEVYQKWKAMLHHYYEPFPVVEHFKTVFENENNH